jgi:outer membrane protein OmpA-like peptidoglycan-associated protein
MVIVARLFLIALLAAPTIGAAGAAQETAPDKTASDKTAPDSKPRLEAPGAVDVLAPPEITTPPAPADVQPEPQLPDAPQPLPEKPPVEKAQKAPGASKTTPADPAAFRDRRIRLLFEPGLAALSLKSAEALDALAGEIIPASVRIELLAYASKKDASDADARRLSLKRAFSVRGYLMDKGVDGTRIDLRALGPAEKGPPERVDIEFLAP